MGMKNLLLKVNKYGLNFVRVLMLFALFLGCNLSSFSQEKKGAVVTIKGTLIKVVPSLKDSKAKDNNLNKKKKKKEAAADEAIEEASEKIRKQDFNVTPKPDTVVQRTFINPVQNTAPNTNTPNPTEPNSPDPPVGGSAMLNFDGLDFSSVSPADPSLCSGPNHIIQMVNQGGGSFVKIWNRNGATLLAKSTMSVLLGNSYLGGGDPVALYDQFTDRYMITEFGKPLEGSTFINSLIIAVSQTADPTGGWYVYRFQDNSFFVDYPHFGVWPNILYATSNDFNTAATTYLGSSVYAFNKVKMTAGDPAPEAIRIRLTDPDGRFGSIAPVSISGNTPPSAGSPGLFMYYNDDNFTPSIAADVDSISILSLQPDFVVPTNTVLSFVQGLNVAAFKSGVCNTRNCIPSAGTGYDALSNRIMNRVYYRKFPTYETLVLNYTVDANFPATPTKAGLRWYELRKTASTWSIFQQSTFAPDVDSRWMGSIAINSKGQIALGYNHSGAGKFASIYYAGRQSTDVPNTLTTADVLIRTGTAYGTFGNRWGDYNDICTDVVNDSLFWMNAMYGSAASTWSTRIAAFKLNGCAAAQVLNNPIDVAICATSNATFSATALGATSFEWELSTDAGETFSTVPNAAPYSTVSTATLNITGAAASLNNNYYRCKILNACSPTYSTPGKLTVVSAPVITPTAATICSGTVQQLSIAFGGAPGPVGGTGTWSPITNLFTNAAATTAYTGTAINTVYAKPNSSISYSVTAGAGACSATATNVTITVNPIPTVTAPTVTQPACPLPTAGTIVVNATGTGILEYSLNGGAYQTSNTFSGLLPGAYSIAVRIQTSPTCVVNYSSNPIIITPAGTTMSTVSYTGPAVSIPDNLAAGVNINLPVTGVASITDLNFRFDAASSGTCNATIGNTNAAVDHTFIGDLIFKLTSPLGTSVTIMNSRGGTTENICTTLLDDDGGFPSLSTVPGVTGTFLSGNFAPDNPLSVFDGQNPNGTWVLNVSDNAAIDVGSLRRFSLIFTTVAPCPCVAPTITAPTVTQPASCAAPTGIIVVNATGSGTLEYSINGGSTYQTSNTFTGLGAGNYTIFVRLQATPTCVASYGSNPVVINAPPAAPIVTAPTVTQSTCAVTTGTIVVNATGIGTLEYSINGGTTYQASNTFSALAASSYNIVVRLQTTPTCFTSYSSNPVVINAAPVPPVFMAPTITQPTCTVATGTIVVNATGSGTLEYSINGGTTYQLSNTFSGLAASSYNIVVRLQANPTCVTSYSSNPVVLNASATLPIVTAPTVTQPTCILPTGTIVVNATGSGTLEYSINGGTTYQLSNTFNGLSVANYNIAVRVLSSTCVSNYSSNPVVITAPIGCVCTLICPANITVNATTGLCGAIVTFAATTSVGSCGTITTTPASGSFFPVGITTVNSTSTSGGSCSFTVTVNDVQSPAITCPAPITVSCASAVPAPNIALVTATDNCTAVAVTHVSDIISSQTCTNRYTITRTYRATDVAGNFSNCIQTITVNDVTPPTITCPANITVNTAAGACNAVVNFTSTATDNCGGAITITSVPASGSTFAVGTTTVTTTATDACGNISTCTFTVTVNDVQPPIITCPAAITVSCASAVPAPNTALVTASDICSAVTKTFISDVITSQTCTNRYIITRTYRATDASGNFTNCTQIITVNDITAPVLTCPANITVNAAAVSCNAVVNFSPTATDNCGGTITIASVPASGSTFAVGTTTVTTTATDACGNISTCTFTVTVNDVQPPTITCPAAITVSCASAVPLPNITLVTAIDNCSTTTIVHVSDVISNQTCTNRYSITRTYRATDAVGNFATCTQIITVNDIIPPVLTCPVNVTVCSAAGIPAANIAVVTAVSDNCGGAVAITFVGDVNNCPTCITSPYTITRTYRATDVCGNFSDCSQTITVNPTATVLPIANQVLCNNINTTAVNFASPTTGGSIVYNWTNNATSIGLAATGTGNINSFVGINTTNVVIVATITVTPSYTNAGVTCVGTANTFTITVNPAPTVTLAPFAAICKNALALTLTGGNPIPTVGNTGIYFVDGVVQTVFNPANYTLGLHTIMYQYTTAAGCVKTATQNIIVLPIHTVEITVAPSAIRPDMPVTVIATVSPVDNYTYTWSRNNTLLPTQILDRVRVLANDAGNYQVTVTAPNGCAVVSNNAFTSSVAVEQILFVYPDPNNGIFNVSYNNGGANLTSRTLSVFDNKGARVFTQIYSVNIPFGNMKVDISQHARGQYQVVLLDATGRQLGSASILKL
jgi:subtilisin-like proprotein convertase family protein